MVSSEKPFRNSDLFWTCRVGMPTYRSHIWIKIGSLACTIERKHFELVDTYHHCKWSHSHPRPWEDERGAHEVRVAWSDLFSLFSMCIRLVFFVFYVVLVERFGIRLFWNCDRKVVRTPVRGIP
jgi:hypothetical protein